MFFPQIPNGNTSVRQSIVTVEVNDKNIVQRQTGFCDYIILQGYIIDVRGFYITTAFSFLSHPAIVFFYQHIHSAQNTFILKGRFVNNGFTFGNVAG